MQEEHANKHAENIAAIGANPPSSRKIQSVQIKFDNARISLYRSLEFYRPTNKVLLHKSTRVGSDLHLQKIVPLLG